MLGIIRHGCTMYAGTTLHLKLSVQDILRDLYNASLICVYK
jgi:hypothetical protein